MIDHERISHHRSGELDWLLDDLVMRVREVRHTVVLSNDGLAVGASSGLSREDAEHLAAIASGFNSLAKGAGRQFHTGGVRQTMVEMDDGFLFVAAAGDGSCLAVLSSVSADIGLIAYEMARLVKRVGEHLHTPPRLTVTPPPPADPEKPMNEDSTGGGPSVPGSQWYDAEAGPLVRPYAMTGGRTKPGPSNVRFDLIALVVVDDDPPGPAEESLLGPEHRSLLALCRAETQSVAELSADADLPVGVVRVLLGDLLESGFVRVSRPVPPAQLPDERILREVIDGLRAL